MWHALIPACSVLLSFNLFLLYLCQKQLYAKLLETTLGSFQHLGVAAVEYTCHFPVLPLSKH